jgi:alcohol dehydrogenase class IV
VIEPFTWHDDVRTIAFGRGRVADAPDLLGDAYVLLTTPRAVAAAPAVAERAATRIDVRPGQVDEIAGELLDAAPRPRAGSIVALGGGRVIDVAKALASGWEGDAPGWAGRVAAVPTTLSAAQMTHGHRQAPGRSGPFVRPTTVLDDPALSASQPVLELAASAMNALGHAFEAPMTVNANPVTGLVAHEAARLLARAWDATDPGPEERDALSLGALLSGYALDGAGFGLHHVMAQTLVRFAGVGHGPANAIMLPHTTRALARRRPERMQALADALDDDPASVAAALAARTGATRLRDAGVAQEQLADCADQAAARPQLELTPPAADRVELLALYEAAW